ncbi:MAG TPA: hypothetical protein VHS31_02340 [Tepidisphaeraceae bacterium]|jgi:hypothetical protein|nr:hypothetical protein [Tepidisphaeraceae bacterium]
MSQLTLNLSDKIAAELAEASRKANLSPGDLAMELLQRGLAVRRFRSAREAIINSLGDKAPDTDEEAFKMLP